jgi:hypothetical protein
MTLWHRTPREVYRVYGEDEYLAEEAPTVDEEAEPAQAREHDAASQAFVEPPSRRAHSGRLVGVGLLVGVTASAIALVALSAVHRLSTAHRPVAQVARKDDTARAATGVSVDGASAAQGSDRPNPRTPDGRTRARARPSSWHASGGHRSTGSPSAGRPPAERPSTGHRPVEAIGPSTGHLLERPSRRVGEPTVAEGSAGSASEAVPVAPVQPSPPTMSEAQRVDAQAPPIGEFEFER